MNTPEDFLKNLQKDKKYILWESNFGRDLGWVVEYQNQKIALLQYPKSSEMFWDDYLVLPYPTNTPNQFPIYESKFWAELSRDQIKYKNSCFGDYVPAYMGPELSGFEITHRLRFKGLYYNIGRPNIFELLKLKLRGNMCSNDLNNLKGI